MDKPKILAIDDESNCLEIISFALTSRGYDVFTVTNGEAAVDFLLADEHKIDLILLDMMIPQINGLDTLEKIRKIETAHNIPVIFQTGSSCYMPTGGDPVSNNIEYIIRKPYKRDDLLKIVKEALEHSKQLNLCNEILA
jgi:two-component system alkaline phosphatase synthesis response regulator PhoP